MAFYGTTLMPKLSFEPKITAGNILTIVAMILAGFGAWYALKQDVLAATKDIAVLQSQIQPVEDITTRLAVVERNQVTGKEAREAFQNDAKQTLELLRQQNLQIMQQLAAITARLDVQDRAN